MQDEKDNSLSRPMITSIDPSDLARSGQRPLDPGFRALGAYSGPTYILSNPE